MPAPASQSSRAARRGRAAEALAARHGLRLDRPTLRKDLVIRRLVQIGEVTWVVKQPETNKIYNFDDDNWALIELFDGTRTRTEILEEYRAAFSGGRSPFTLVLDFEEMLRRIDLLEQSASERNLQLLSKFKRPETAGRRGERRGLQRLLHALQGLRSRPVPHPDAQLRPLDLASAGRCRRLPDVRLHDLGLRRRTSTPIWAQTLELYAFLRKPFWDAVQFFVILTGIGAIHEFAHGYVTKFYGGEVHDIGIALLYFMPAFYCDTTDSLLFQSKWQRL